MRGLTFTGVFYALLWLPNTALAANVTSLVLSKPNSLYIAACEQLLSAATTFPKALVSLILHYKNTTDAHAQAIGWLEQSIPDSSLVPSLHFPIAGIQRSRVDTHTSECCDKSTLPRVQVFILRFFNTSEAGSAAEASKQCKQYWHYNNETGQLDLTMTLPLGICALLAAPFKNGTGPDSKNNTTDILTSSPDAPYAIIPVEEDRALHVQVVDHSPNMTDPTKNRCFDYWIEKPLTKSKCFVL